MSFSDTRRRSEIFQGGKVFTDYLKKLVRREDLSEEEAASAIAGIMEGSVTQAQLGAFMGALAVKGETFAELAGAARAMRRKARRIQVSAKTVLDTCGTGGDGASTFNISTAAAFVAAACGVTVAKHGNRSVSSRCGSADVLEELGVNLQVEPEVVEEAVAALGIGFLFAPLYHEALRHAAGARREVGFRSIFNMLGPLANPAGATCQLLGVFAPQLTEMFAEALRLLGVRRALVVHGHEGLDEISVCAPTRVSELKDGLIRTYDVTPEQIVGRRWESKDLLGGERAQNAAIIRNIFDGGRGACRDVVVANTAGALMAAGLVDGFASGVAKAEEALDSGASRALLESLARFTQENG
jgi:anthranilate phosphoribosyltransferase